MMTVEGLKPGTTYVFRVRARTDGGYGSYGGEIELETSHEGEKGTAVNCLLSLSSVIRPSPPCACSWQKWWQIQVNFGTIDLYNLPGEDVKMKCRAALFLEPSSEVLQSRPDILLSG